MCTNQTHSKQQQNHTLHCCCLPLLLVPTNAVFMYFFGSLIQLYGKQKQTVGANGFIGLSDNEFLGPSESNQQTDALFFLFFSGFICTQRGKQRRPLLVCNGIAQWLTSCAVPASAGPCRVVKTPRCTLCLHVFGAIVSVRAFAVCHLQLRMVQASGSKPGVASSLVTVTTWECPNLRKQLHVCCSGSKKACRETTWKPPGLRVLWSNSSGH
jgi:hypothetical protein